MGFLDLVLNIIAVLLWINWRVDRSLVSLGTGHGHISHLELSSSSMGRVNSRRGFSGWKKAVIPARQTLFCLGLILLGKPLIYHYMLRHMMEWNPMLKLGVVSIPFSMDYLGQMYLFSIASFILTLFIVYMSMILIRILSRGETSIENSFQNVFVGFMARSVEGWPVFFKICLPGVVGGILWLIFAPIIEVMEVLPDQSWSAVFKECIVLGLASYLPWGGLVMILLGVHIITCKFRLGTSSIWSYLDYINAKLIKPLSYLQLQIFKYDFTALVELPIVYLICVYYRDFLTGLFAKAMF